MYSKEIVPMCTYCQHARGEHDNKFLCLHKGVVAFDYSCKKYRYDATKRIPPRKKPLIPMPDGEIAEI